MINYLKNPKETQPTLACYLHLTFSMFFILLRAYRITLRKQSTSQSFELYNTFWKCKLRVGWRIEGLIQPPSRPRVSSSPHANLARRVPGRVHTSLFRHRTFQFRRRLWKADQHVWTSATAHEWSPLVAGATIWKNRPPKRTATTDPSRCYQRDNFSLTGKSGMEFCAERYITEN